MWDNNITSTDFFLLYVIGSGLFIILLAGTIYSLCLRALRRKTISDRQKSKGPSGQVNMNKNQTGNGNPVMANFKPQEVKSSLKRLSLKSMRRTSSVAKRPIGTGFYTAPSVDAHPAMSMDPVGFDQVFSSADWMSGYLYALQFQHVSVIMEEQGKNDMNFTTNNIIHQETNTASSSSSSASATSGNIKVVSLDSANLLGNHNTHNNNSGPHWILASPPPSASFVQLVKPYPIPVFGMMNCSSSISEVHVDSGYSDHCDDDAAHQADYSTDDHTMDMAMDFGDGGAACGF